MYKGNSASLQRYHKVHEINVQPSTQLFEDDLIPTAANMSWAECEAERRAIVLEKTKMANELVAAKRMRDRRQIEALGLRQQTYDGRLGLIKQRMETIRKGHEYMALRQAIDEAISDAERRAIYRRMRVILDETCRGS